MAPTYHGSCLCGEVNFEVHAEPILVTCCHCTNCKKHTGTVFSSNVVFPADTENVTKGASLISTFHDTAQDSGNVLFRYFCNRCGTPLYNVGGDAPRILAVFYSALDDFDVGGENPAQPGEKVRAAKAPQMEFYARDRTAWVRPIEGAEQINTKPGRDP
ncbi:Mss4-like protein [Phellopilus nigrolimitatus]|nr:Mss4-like protein [Phellopilus nigrolimitatus]